MKKILLFLIAAITMATAMASQKNEYLFRVGQFDQVKVIDNVKVVYRCHPDSTGIATFKGAQEFDDAFILTNNGKCLKIQVNIDDVNNPELPTLYIYSDFLTSVENSSDFELMIESMQPCPEFKALQVGNGSITADGIKANSVTAAVVAGNGTINLSGTTGKATYRMLAAGSILADRLKATEVECKILGAGNIGCWPVEFLKVKGLGSTKIYYKGNPEIKKSGSGKLFPLPEDE